MKRMQAARKRLSRRPALVELSRLRKLKYPHLKQKEFAVMLGVTRLHLYAVESGRRQPSMELALRWIQALAPEAKLEMFGSVPALEAQVRQVKTLAEVSPEYYQAA